MRSILATIILFVLTGCSLLGPAAQPQRGGAALVSPAHQSGVVGQKNATTEAPAEPGPTLGMPRTSLIQPDNPNSTSSQGVDYEYEEVTVIPIDTMRETTTNYSDGHSVTVKEPIPGGTRVIKKAKSKVEQNLGSSWRDTAREMGAALASFQVVQYVGIAVLLLGAAAFFHPVLRTLIGGKDTAMAIGACGAAMIFGPYLFVQYSKWFFLALIAAGCYWLIARFKYQHGQLDALSAPKPNTPNDQANK